MPACRFNGRAVPRFGRPAGEAAPALRFDLIELGECGSQCAGVRPVTRDFRDVVDGSLAPAELSEILSGGASARVQGGFALAFGRRKRRAIATTARNVSTFVRPGPIDAHAFIIDRQFGPHGERSNDREHRRFSSRTHEALSAGRDRIERRLEEVVSRIGHLEFRSPVCAETLPTRMRTARR